MLVKTYGSAVYGVDAITITVEVNVMKGKNYFIVGLPDNAINESLQRVESALKINGYRVFKKMKKLFDNRFKNIILLRKLKFTLIR